eukprot:Awhi_evm1s15625
MARRRLQEFGINSIPFTPTSIPMLFVSEFSTFFYYYQFIMYIVWVWFSYLFIALMEVSVVILSAIINVYIQWNNEKAIAQLTKHEATCNVKRDGNWTKLSARFVVPGDIVQVEEKSGIPCDMVLVSGNALVNESSLTGESKPVQKTACRNESAMYNPHGSGVKHTLFAGTAVLQNETTNQKSTSPLAIVTATGINTSKGELVSQILFPEKTSFRYEEELKIVFVILGVYSIVASIISICFIINSGSNSSWVTMWAYVIFTVSQVMSPLLPVALQVGQIRSCQRLKEKDVYCVNPGRIAISGKIRIFCFDKTGTLNKDGMDFSAVVPVVTTLPPFSNTAITNDDSKTVMKDLNQKGKFLDVITNVDQSNDIPLLMKYALATCHSLTLYGASDVVGNEVETKMFQAIKWNLGAANSSGICRVTSPETFPGQNIYSLDILKKFEFNHELQTMSVIVEDASASTNNTPKKRHCFVKGSFEKSIPEDYLEQARQFALDGGYVLALAHRNFDSMNITIEDASRLKVEEKEKFTLLGLMIFRNEAK